MTSLLSFFSRSRHPPVGSDSIAVFIESIERDPRQEVAYIDLLDASEKQGNLAGAIAYLTTLVNREPKLDGPYRYLLAAYNRQGDLDGLGRLVAQYRENEAAHQWFLMDAYTKSDWNAAIAILSSLAVVHSGDERWARYLSAAYDNRGDLEAAISGLTKLLEVCPESASLREHLDDYRSKAARAAGRTAPGAAKAEPQPDRTASGSGLGTRNAEFERNLKLRTKLHEIEARDRERKRVEFQLQTRPRPLTAREKFNRIKPTGSRDGFG